MPRTKDRRQSFGRRRVEKHEFCKECGALKDEEHVVSGECEGPEPDLDVCPVCGGPADNGHDRAYPPSPYLCTKCQVYLESIGKAIWARNEFGPHPSASFAIARITEELGELSKAATATSKGRDVNRRPRIRAEAVDVIAMVLRLLEEFPDGVQ